MTASTKALRKARAARIRKRDECAAKQRDERANQNEDTVIPDEVKLANMVSMGISFLESNELFRMHAHDVRAVGVIGAGIFRNDAG